MAVIIERKSKCKIKCRLKIGDRDKSDWNENKN